MYIYILYYIVFPCISHLCPISLHVSNLTSSKKQTCPLSQPVHPPACIAGAAAGDGLSSGVHRTLNRRAAVLVEGALGARGHRPELACSRPRKKARLLFSHRSVPPKRHASFLKSAKGHRHTHLINSPSPLSCTSPRSRSPPTLLPPPGARAPRSRRRSCSQRSPKRRPSCPGRPRSRSRAPGGTVAGDRRITRFGGAVGMSSRGAKVGRSMLGGIVETCAFGGM